MTDEEIEKRLQDLAYLKIHPRDQEENKLLLLKGERLYEESVGDKRQYIEYELQLFERALHTHDAAKIAPARERLEAFLKTMEKEL